MAKFKIHNMYSKSGIIKKANTKAEHLELKEIFENNIERFVIPQIIERVKDYLEELEKGENLE